MIAYINATFLILFLCTYFYFIFSKKVHISSRIVLLLGGFYMSLFPFLLSQKIRVLLGENYRYFANTINTFFIICIILYLIILITKLTRLYKPSKLFANSILILSAILGLHSLHEGTKVPQLKEVVITNADITAPKKIIFLSDIHINKNVNIKKIAGLVEATNQEKPDAILLGGDIIDDTPKNNAPYLKELQKLKAKDGIYFATGNHEVYRGALTSVGQLTKAGFQYLFNRGVLIGGNIYIAAIPDVRAQKNQIFIEDALISAPKDSYKILISHTPYDFGPQNALFDIMLSGHTHGGQIFPFHILAKNQHKYLSGLYDMDNDAQIYVSNGAGQWGPQLRFFAPAEITVIKLLPYKK